MRVPAYEHAFVAPRKKPGPRRSAGETRRLVAELRAAGHSYKTIAAKLGTTKSTVAYHARRLGVEADDRFAIRYDWTEIKHAYEVEGLSVRQCMARFGFTSASWSKAVARGAVIPRPRRMTIDALLVNGKKRGRYWLKARLIEEGLKEERCEACGITNWLGKPLAMQLHHVNGDGHDNRLENLELLCPNCHSQTDTYGGRNGHRRRKAA
jgi:5-methylcytosine-specific restriction endonuclease McrA